MVRRWWRRLNGVLVLPIGTHMLRRPGTSRPSRSDGPYGWRCVRKADVRKELHGPCRNLRLAFRRLLRVGGVDMMISPVRSLCFVAFVSLSPTSAGAPSSRSPALHGICCQCDGYAQPAYGHHEPCRAHGTCRISDFAADAPV